MICNRCKRRVPAGDLVCPCFVTQADEEQRALSAIRFLAGEISLKANSAGHARVPGRDVAFCGQEWKSKGSSAATAMPFACPRCTSAIKSLAEKLARRPA